MKNILIKILILSVIVIPFESMAFSGKDTYPKLANYYLQPLVLSSEYDNLAKYDMLILDIDAESASPGILNELKNKNSRLDTMAYVPSQSVNFEGVNSWGQFRTKMFNHVNEKDLWLKDQGGNVLSFSPTWSTIKFVDIGKEWDGLLPREVCSNINSKPWDGVYYDMVFANLSWLNNGDIDINRDGKKDSVSSVNSYWQKSTENILKNTKAKTDKPIVINVDIADNYATNSNGAMFENFPVKWLGENSWSKTVDYYTNKLPVKNQSEQVYIVNSNTANTGTLNDYKKMRFGLASTLLGDGYFSFDYGDQDHAQTWWYDEYDVSLGLAQSKAYNLSDKNNSQVKPGLWRRDFEFGISLVNSTNEKKTYVFSKEEFEKINGTQDRRVNNGTKTNYVTLEPNDGLVLKKINNEIRNNSFNNGSFARVFDKAGKQTRNGFFAYKDQSPGNTQIMVSDIDDDGQDEMLVNGNGTISIYDKSKLIKSFKPYDGAFKGEISFAVGDLNGDGTKEIITGAGAGGGPHVRTFSKDGKLLSGGFFAYDKNFRGGVNVAVLDLNGDGTKEIITGAGAGGGPHIRTFSSGGKLLTGGFFAYDKNFRGGVDVSVGEVDGDGVKEIIVAPGKGGGPQVRIFSTNGKLESQFFAYGQEEKSGLQVMADDLNNDGLDEILVSLREMN